MSESFLSDPKPIAIRTYVLAYKLLWLHGTDAPLESQ